MVYFPIVHDGSAAIQGQSQSEMSLLGHRDCADSVLGADRTGSAAVGFIVRRLIVVKPWQPPTSVPTPDAVKAVDAVDDEVVATEAEVVDEAQTDQPEADEAVEAEEDSGLPSMADLDRLSAELDEIDATLARMDGGKASSEQPSPDSLPPAAAPATAGTAPAQPRYGGNQFGGS